MIFCFLLLSLCLVQNVAAGFWSDLFGALEMFSNDNTATNEPDPIPQAIPVQDPVQDPVNQPNNNNGQTAWWEDLFNNMMTAMMPVQAPVVQPAAMPASSAVGHGASCALPAGGFGTCQDVLVSSCSSQRLTGLCPGPANVLCCPGSQPQVTPAPKIPSVEPGVGATCRYTSGTCQDIRVERCPFARVRNQCPGNANVLCCPSTPSNAANPLGPVMTSDGSGSCSAYKGLAFPLASGSLREISVNWGGSRSGGRRCHAGLDIYTSGARRVQAVADGVVTNIMKNWYKCSGGNIDAIFVYHESGPLRGKTINYGEVNPGTYTVRTGSRVTQGQSLGVASFCGMLHFELYQGRRETNLRWSPRNTVGAGCTRTSMSTLPYGLLDPRPILRCTAPPNPRFRHGIGFLSEPNGAFAEDLAEEGDEVGVDGGKMSVAAIVVIASALAIICVVSVMMIALLIVRRNQRDALHESNQLYMVTAGAADDNAMQSAVFSGRSDSTIVGGEFGCELCGKSYNFIDDLIVHKQLRHP